MASEVKNLLDSQIRLYRSAEDLTRLFNRLNKFELFGDALMKRCRQSQATRVCLNKELPLLRRLYPEVHFFEAENARKKPSIRKNTS